MTFKLKEWRLYFFIAAFVMACVALPFSKMVSQAGIILLIAIWLTEGNWSKKLQIVKGNLFLVCILLFYMLNVIGVLYSEDKQTAYGNLERYFPIVFVPLIFGTTDTRIPPESLRMMISSFVVAVVCSTLVCLTSAFINYQNGAQLLGLGTPEFDMLHVDISNSAWLAFSYTDLTSALSIHPGFLALYVCFAMIVLHHWSNNLATGKKAQWLCWGAIAYLTTFLLLLSARIMLVTFALLAIVYILKTFNSRKAEALKLIGVLMLAVFLLMANPVTWYRTFQEMFISEYAVEHNNHYTNSTEIRLSLWWLAGSSLNANNVMLGNGTGDTRLTMHETASRLNISNVLNTHDPHNQFLFTLLANGLIGLALISVILFFPLLIALNLNDVLLSGFCILFISLCLTESALELQKGIGFFSLFGSLLLYRINGFEVISAYTQFSKLKAILR
ncbi:MAG TPA: O-antigen ligase family protein [Chryseosolibacter sp.]|nr:O-antigen ligase family protein [Chryseosolibacter sp.]